MTTTEKVRATMCGLGLFTIFVVFGAAMLAKVEIQTKQGEAYTLIAEAHQARDWAAVLDIYHGNLVVRFLPDRRVQELDYDGMYDRPPGSVDIQVGDAYQQLGQEEDANRHYLKALGWSETQYDAWCRLSVDCAPLSRLARSSLVGSIQPME